MHVCSRRPGECVSGTCDEVDMKFQAFEEVAERQELVSGDDLQVKDRGSLGDSRVAVCGSKVPVNVNVV